MLIDNLLLSCLWIPVVAVVLEIRWSRQTLIILSSQAIKLLKQPLLSSICMNKNKEKMPFSKLNRNASVVN